MKVQKVIRYKNARYPQGSFAPYKNKPLPGKSLLIPLTIAAAIESCIAKPIGACGPPPMMPQFVTENEARMAVEKVFREQGLEIARDVPVTMKNGDTVTLDGFNAAQNIGYEYISQGDRIEFTREVILELQAREDMKLLLLHPVREYDVEMLEQQTRQFITQLRAGNQH